MAERKLIRRKQMTAEEVEEAEAAVAEAETDEVEVDEAEIEKDVDEDNDEDEDEPAPKKAHTIGKKVVAVPAKNKVQPAAPKKVVKKVAEPEEDDDDLPEHVVDDDEDEAALPKVNRKVVGGNNKIKKSAVVNVSPKTTVKVQKPADIVKTSLVDDILSRLAAGQSVTIIRLENGNWKLADSKAAKDNRTTVGLRGAAYWDEVCSPEYIEWEKEWRELTMAERLARAKKAKVTWEEHADARINQMRLVDAYRQKLGIEKYKPEYQERSARDAVRKDKSAALSAKADVEESEAEE